jgi:hypothetical protein
MATRGTRVTVVVTAEYGISLANVHDDVLVDFLSCLLDN